MQFQTILGAAALMLASAGPINASVESPEPLRPSKITDPPVVDGRLDEPA